MAHQNVFEKNANLRHSVSPLVRKYVIYWLEASNFDRRGIDLTDTTLDLINYLSPSRPTTARTVIVCTRGVVLNPMSNVVGMERTGLLTV